MNAGNRLRQNIVRMRQRKGWTQEHLAFEAEISKANMCDIESGKGNPTLRTIEKIAKALEIPAWLLLK